jgi:hypothetical protein
MAWKFLNPQDSHAVRRQQALLQKIDRWWATFRARTRDLDDLFHRRQEWDLPAWMEANLQDINPHLMWEFGADVAGGGHRLVITPESEKHLRPLVETILERAPAVPGWTFCPYRQPETLAEAAATVEARTGQDLCSVKAAARIGEQHCVDLVFHSPTYSLPVDQEGWNAAFVAAESLLGEEMLDKWVGAIHITPDAEGRRFLPLDRLRGTVSALVSGITDQLPNRPCHQLPEEPGGAVFKRQPEEMADYPFKADLFTASTMFPEFWQCAHASQTFYSVRFSRFAERFAYVKIDGRKGPDGNPSGDRGTIEDALDNALKPAGLGCVIGSGTGLRYSYIDLALTDVGRASRAICKVLQQGRIARRSWLLFFDCEWEREWVGAWEDTPAPPV